MKSKILNMPKLETNFLNETFFSKDDLTAGTETELQAAVMGEKEEVDLPQFILNSTFYKNLTKRCKSGDINKNKLEELNLLVNSSSRKVWENSWVVINKNKLEADSYNTFLNDLKSDKDNPNSPKRFDENLFFIKKGEKEYIRIPISYLLKLSFADILYQNRNLPAQIYKQGESLLSHYTNDNTSPETLSFYISKAEDIGESVANETAIRFLFTQLLVEYANIKFELKESGQEVLIYKSPLTPFLQKKINSLIPDNLYREIFISPCLSGWQQGEKKKEYMIKCHKVLSNSKLNTIGALKDAGIIKNNLIVLPDTSNTSLTNNGIHLSIGSKLLTEKLKNGDKDFTYLYEKRYSDLVIKIAEHFLTLFVGIYSAAPYRIKYRDFHPENILGFLPHELDFTHLRMLFRRWKKKAIRKNFFFNRITPFGPIILDSIIEKLFFQKGDFVEDYRVIDYFISLLSTESEYGFDGNINNQKMLKKALQQQGIFDEDLSFYSLIKGRYFLEKGFFGFELRVFSNFYSLRTDLKFASNLFALIIALSFYYIKHNIVTFNDIPDGRTFESEVRQIFFASATGVPTFYVKENSQNRFLISIVSKCKNIRKSRRYKGYIRVEVEDFRIALFEKIQEDAKDFIADYKDTISDLKEKLANKEQRSSYKIITEVLAKNRTDSPIKIEADKFNMELENYYRSDLKNKHISEGFDALIDEISKLDFSDKKIRETFIALFGDAPLISNLFYLKKKFLNREANIEDILQIVKSALFIVEIKNNKENRCLSTAIFKERAIK